MFFFSSRRRHTRCALVTGVQRVLFRSPEAAPMYAVPKEIPTRLFARLPEELRLRDRSSGWAFGKESGAMHSFLEGPSFDREGNLYLVDIPYGRIDRKSTRLNSSH